MLRGFEVDYKLDFCDLLDRKFSRLDALENFVNVERGAMILLVTA